MKIAGGSESCAKRVPGAEDKGPARRKIAKKREKRSRRARRYLWLQSLRRRRNSGNTEPEGTLCIAAGAEAACKGGRNTFLTRDGQVKRKGSAKSQRFTLTTSSLATPEDKLM